MLIEHQGADVHALTKDQRSCMHYAATTGKPDYLQKLFNKGGKSLLKRTAGESGMNALHVVVQAMAETPHGEGDDASVPKLSAFDGKAHSKKRAEKKAKKERTNKKELKKEKSNTDIKKKSPRRMILKSPRKHAPSAGDDACESEREKERENQKEKEKKREREENKKRKKQEEEALLLGKLQLAEAENYYKANEEKLKCVAFLLKVCRIHVCRVCRVSWH